MQGFKFTLLAASYTNRRGTYEKPFSITLPEDDPRISEFRGNRSFREEPVTLSEPAETAPEPVKSGIALEAILDEPIAVLLKENGFETAEQVMDTTKDDLLEIKGIGEATADKVLAACEEALTDNDFGEE